MHTWEKVIVITLEYSVFRHDDTMPKKYYFFDGVNW